MSSSDQAILKSAANPFEEVTDSPPATTATAPSSSSGSASGGGWSTPKVIDWDTIKELVPLPGVAWNVPLGKGELGFDPQRAALQKKANFHEKMHPLAINTHCQRAAVGFTVSFSVPKPQTRLSLIDLATGKAVHSTQVEARMRPLALMDNGNTMLMGGTSDERGGYETGDQLQIWRLNGKKIIRTPSWIPHPAESKAFGKVNNAAIGSAYPIKENLILTLSNSAHLVLWDIYKREPVWHAKLNTRNFGVDVSTDRRHVAVFNDKIVMVVDALTAEILGSTALQVARVGWNRIRWSPSGTKLLLSSVGDLRVVDVKTGELEQDIHLSDTPMATRGLSYPHEEYALLDNHLLVHLPSKIQVCDYRDATSIRILGGTAFIAIQTQSNGILVPAKFPHPAATAALKTAQDDPTMFLIHPGVGVAIDVSRVPGQYSQEVRNGLTQSVSNSGYKLDPASEIKLVASISGPKTEAVSYIARGSYVVNQYQSDAKLEWKGKSLWKRGGTNIPHMLSTKRDETIKQALDRHGKRPNTSIFANLKFPEFMQRPSENAKPGQNSNALMTSKFTLGGLVDSK